MIMTSFRCLGKRLAPVALAGVVAASLPLPAGAQTPIKIGASMSVTGTYAKPGSYQKEGYDVCIDELNGKGGLLGRKVELVIYDDQSQPATAVKLYEKLITEDKVDAVMGPYSSAVSEAVANVTEKYKKVMVAPLAATTSIFKKGRKYIFMVITPAENYLDGLIDMAAKRGLKTVAIINEDTLFPKASAAGTAEAAKKRGMQVVLQEAYPKGNTDFSALLVKIKAANPDVIAAGTYFDDAVAITRQMKELNVNPKMFGLTVGGDLPEFYDLLKQNAEYIYGSTQWDESLPYPGQKEFLAAYTKKFKHEPSYHAAAGYAGCLIYGEAVKRAGTLDADKVREQLLKMEIKTAFGDYKVEPDGFQVAHKMVMLQWQDGKRVVVWPDDLASGKMRYPTPEWGKR
ncbi:MAG TPA: amino acid ABC transporter substrate-binding protein [Methylomirabilota bacterium]|jgi:branched-chain amino acid transport system substrate-binding protein|nr:amino acid ABC transporter substrate-binding protein [Methylomirabilota bacterium]